jgi:CheY-like chemotaxis protein
MASILYIEDEPSWQMQVRDSLGIAGHQVTAVKTLDSAMVALGGKHNFDIVIFDLYLGDQLGNNQRASLAAFLKRADMEGLDLPPIIILTGLSLSIRQVADLFSHHRNHIADIWDKMTIDWVEFRESVERAVDFAEERSSKRQGSLLVALGAGVFICAVVAGVFYLIVDAVGQIPDPQSQQVMLKAVPTIIIAIAVFIVVLGNRASVEDILKGLKLLKR